MTVKTNTTRAVIFIIAKIAKRMAVSLREKSVLFVAKKIISLISIQMITNRSRKNSKDKTENSVEIKTNITYF